MSINIYPPRKQLWKQKLDRNDEMICFQNIWIIKGNLSIDSNNIVLEHAIYFCCWRAASMKDDVSLSCPSSNNL